MEQRDGIARLSTTPSWHCMISGHHRRAMNCRRLRSESNLVSRQNGQEATVHQGRRHWLQKYWLNTNKVVEQWQSGHNKPDARDGQTPRVIRRRWASEEKQSIMATYEIIGLLAAIIGIISFLWFLHDRFLPYRRLSWRKIRLGAHRITSQILEGEYIPTIVVGIGRDGAIVGALVSAGLGHCPFIVIDRNYTWSGSGRIGDLLFPVKIPKERLTNVLLVVAGLYTGSTVANFTQHLFEIGAKNIKLAALFSQGGRMNPDYVAFDFNHRSLAMPWHGKKSLLQP